MSLSAPIRRRDTVPQAVWNGEIIADSEDTIVVEGNHYFPPESVAEEYLRDSDRTSVCPWKGTARYRDVAVDGEVNDNAAWSYPEPSEAAAQIEGWIAFWHGVEVRA